jgi:transposase
MHLSDHSLSQLDAAYLRSLDEEQLRRLSLRLLEDLEEARERLRQNPTNSARPPSSRVPWERPSAGNEEPSDAGDVEVGTSAQDADRLDEAGTPPGSRRRFPVDRSAVGRCRTAGAAPAHHRSSFPGQPLRLPPSHPRAPAPARSKTRASNPSPGANGVWSGRVWRA